MTVVGSTPRQHILVSVSARPDGQDRLHRQKHIRHCSRPFCKTTGEDVAHAWPYVEREASGKGFINEFPTGEAKPSPVRVLLVHETEKSTRLTKVMSRLCSNAVRDAPATKILAEPSKGFSSTSRWEKEIPIQRSLSSYGTLTFTGASLPECE